MIPKELNASIYQYSSTFYDAEFEDILRGIVQCYSFMIQDNIQLLNDENDIRNKLVHSYLNLNSVRRKAKLTNYLFDPEVPERTGRSDIKIQTKQTFQDTSAYYIIECKRLNNQNLEGSRGLNAEYVKNGICRFVSEYYTSYFGTNGMIGFIVDDLDVIQNIDHINNLLLRNFTNDRGVEVNARISQEMRPILLEEGFKYSYLSKHQVGVQKKIFLYHLMLDFSDKLSENEV